MTCGVSAIFHYMTSDAGGIFRRFFPLDFLKKVKKSKGFFASKIPPPETKKYETRKFLGWGANGLHQLVKLLLRQHFAAAYFSAGTSSTNEAMPGESKGLVSHSDGRSELGRQDGGNLAGDVNAGA